MTDFHRINRGAHGACLSIRAFWHHLCLLENIVRSVNDWTLTWCARSKSHFFLHCLRLVLYPSSLQTFFQLNLGVSFPQNYASTLAFGTSLCILLNFFSLLTLCARICTFGCSERNFFGIRYRSFVLLTFLALRCFVTLSFPLFSPLYYSLSFPSSLFNSLFVVYSSSQCHYRMAASTSFCLALHFLNFSTSCRRSCTVCGRPMQSVCDANKVFAPGHFVNAVMMNIAARLAVSASGTWHSNFGVQRAITLFFR